MSYSNGKLPENTLSHDKIIEIVKGLPGVGFKLTDDGDYDIQNKKLRNVASPQTNDDATTKSYVDNKALLVDGSNKMSGALNMDDRRIENVGPGRHNTADALTHLQFEAFYFDLNTDSGNTEAQNPINMKSKRILGVKDPILHSDASNKFYVDNSLTLKADKTQLAKYLKKDGSIALTNNLDLGNNEIVNVKEATSGSHAVNLTQLNSELFKHLPKTGGDMTGDIKMDNNSIYEIKNVENDTSAANRKYVNDELDKKLDKNKDFSMGNNKITSLRNPDDSNELANKSYVDQKVSQAGGPASGQFLRLDGSNKMASNLDMNNQRIINLGNATHNQDAITLKQVNDTFSTISTENNKYTDQKIAESHISTHENRKNVLAYAMDDGEFTEDFGIQDVNLITYNDSPHKTNKKAFSLKVQKTNDGSSLFKGRFDFNLFKMIRDNFSDNYTVCIEVYFEKDGRHDSEFDSFNITFEKLNMNIDKSHTIKVNTDYKYYRSILNLSPDGTSPSIQRRLYVNVQSSFDNLSPSLLPLYVLIYGIKGEAKNDIDFTIYDYEKAYEVSNNNLQIHIPINMNNNRIRGLPRSPIDDNGPLTRTYMRLVSFPCLLVGTTEIGTTQCHFSYEMKLDGTTTNIRLANILCGISIRLLKIVIWTNKRLNGTYKLIMNNRVISGIASNVIGLVYNLNFAIHGFNRIFIETATNDRKRFFTPYNVYYRPYNF